eukprot:COSAG01_NODE_11542_length_1908_cov_2.459923_3_plen_47_part_01
MRMSPSLRPHLDASAFGGAWLRVPHGFRLFKLLLHYDCTKSLVVKVP